MKVVQSQTIYFQKCNNWIGVYLKRFKVLGTLWFLGILGTPWGHPRGNSSIFTSILHQPQRYTNLALWRAINFCKESLSVFSLCSWPSALNFKKFSRSHEHFFSHSRSKQFWKQNNISPICTFPYSLALIHTHIIDGCTKGNVFQNTWWR